MKPITDADFFWHLQTGAWIWENKSLPGEFLFTFTAPQTLSPLQRFGMTSYWLSQLVIHLFFAAGGWTGIYALRAVLTTLFVWALVRRREGDGLIFFGLLALAVMSMRIYYFERPQVISFVFFALLLEQLDWFRRSADTAAPVPLTRWFAIPLLMAIWSNCHAGYLIGQGSIVIYLATEALKHLHPALHPIPWPRYRLLMAVGTAGFIAAFINPNTYHGFQVALLPSWTTEFNREYQSTLAIFRESGAPEMLAYWFLLGLAFLATIVSVSRIDLTRITLLFIVGYISFTQLRHVAYLVVVALPLIQSVLSRDHLRTAGRILVLVPALLVGSSLLRSDGEYIRSRPTLLRVDSLLFPVDAADFLDRTRLQGNMYNYYGWGGYLLWRLAPTKVFIDGRNSNRELFDQYLVFDRDADNQFSGGQPAWKALFKSHGIRYTVTPFFGPFLGAVLPLLDDLLADPEWAPIFIGHNSIVFVERTVENHRVIARFAIPRAQVIPLLLERCDRLIRRSPWNPPPYVAKGDLLLRLSRLAEARESYTRAAALIPGSPVVQSRLEWLRGRGVP